MIKDQREAFEITVTIWNRDLKGLFDYSAPPDQLKVSKFRIGNNWNVLKDPMNRQVYFTNGRTKISNSFAFVCTVDLQQKQSNISFWLRSPPKQKAEQNPCNVPYLVLKPSQEGKIQSGFPLKQGDKFKIGQTEYTIIQLKTNHNLSQTSKENLRLKFSVKENNLEAAINSNLQMDQQTNLKTRKRTTDQQFDENTRKTFKYKKIRKLQKNKKAPSKTRILASQKDSSLEKNVQEESQSFQDEKTMKFGSFKHNKQLQLKETQEFQEQQNCKICLSNQQTIQDPFISICQCKGSCSLTHLGCLKSWVNSNTEFLNTFGVKSYLSKRSSCQICKYPFPAFVQLKDSKIPLINFELPNNSYMILQSNDPESIQKNEKRYILIDGQKNKITKIGRNNDVQIKNTDITVSRKHAEIVFQNDQFTIKDKKSKFGTLVKLQNDMKFGDQQVNVQLGRCLFSFKQISKKPALKSTTGNLQ